MDSLLAIDINIVEVVAFQAIIQSIPHIGIGVHQLQQLHCLFLVGAGSGNAGHRALHGVVGENRIASPLYRLSRDSLTGVGAGAQTGTPSLHCGVGPALRHGQRLVNRSIVQVGGVGVDVTGFVPLMQDLEVVHHVFLLEDGNHLVVSLGVGNAQRGQAGTHAVVQIFRNGPAVLIHADGRVARSLIDGSHTIGQVGQGVQILVVGNILLGNLGIPHKEVGQGRVLVSGNAIDLAVNADGIPVLFRHNRLQIGGGFQQVGDIGESAQRHVGLVGAEVGEDDVVGLVGRNNHTAALIPIAIGNDFNIQMDADLLFQILIEICFPGVVVGRLRVADQIPNQRRIFAVGAAGGFVGGRGVPSRLGRSRALVGRGGRGVGIAVLAACEHRSNHHHGQQKCNDSFHFVTSCCWGEFYFRAGNQPWNTE